MEIFSFPMFEDFFKNIGFNKNTASLYIINFKDCNNNDETNEFFIFKNLAELIEV